MQLTAHYHFVFRCVEGKSTWVCEKATRHSMGLAQAAKADWSVSRADTRAMVDAHTAGINFFLTTTSALPVEYKVIGHSPQPWESWHSYAAYKMRNILMGHLDMKLWRARVEHRP